MGLLGILLRRLQNLFWYAVCPSARAGAVLLCCWLHIPRLCHLLLELLLGQRGRFTLCYHGSLRPTLYPEKHHVRKEAHSAWKKCFLIQKHVSSLGVQFQGGWFRSNQGQLLSVLPPLPLVPVLVLTWLLVRVEMVMSPSFMSFQLGLVKQVASGV